MHRDRHAADRRRRAQILLLVDVGEFGPALSDSEASQNYECRDKLDGHCGCLQTGWWGWKSWNRSRTNVFGKPWERLLLSPDLSQNQCKLVGSCLYAVNAATHQPVESELIAESCVDPPGIRSNWEPQEHLQKKRQALRGTPRPKGHILEQVGESDEIIEHIVDYCGLHLSQGALKNILKLGHRHQEKFAHSAKAGVSTSEVMQLIFEIADCC